MRHYLLAFLIVVFLAGSSAAAVGSESAEKAAAGQLSWLKIMLDESQAQELGFDSKKQLDLAQLGRGLEIYTISLDDFGRYKSGDVLRGAFLDNGGRALDRYVYGVRVGAETRALIEVFKDQNLGWLASNTYGSSGFLGSSNQGKIAQFKRVVAMLRNDEQALASAVLVDSCYGLFLAQRVDGKPLNDAVQSAIKMIRIESDRSFDLFGIPAGASMPAEIIFKALAPQARIDLTRWQSGRGQPSCF